MFKINFCGKRKMLFYIHDLFLCFEFFSLSLSTRYNKLFCTSIALSWIHQSFRLLLLTHCVLQLCLFGNSNSLLCLTALLIGNKYLVFLGLLFTLKQWQWRRRATPTAVAQILIHAKSFSAAFASQTSTCHAKHSPTGAGPTSADSLNAFNRQSGYF